MRHIIALAGIAVVVAGSAAYVTHTAGPFAVKGTSEAALAVGSSTLTPNKPFEVKVMDASTSSKPSSSDKLKIHWKQLYNGETDWSIEKSADGQTGWKEIINKPSTQQASDIGKTIEVIVYDSGPFTPDIAAYYRVRSHKGGGYSEYSNINSAWVSMGNPPRPQNVVARPFAAGGVTLEFNDYTRNELGFEIERSTGNSTSFTKVATLPPSDIGNIRYQDNDVISGTIYNYRIRTKNSRGYSRYTDTVSITYTASTASSTPTSTTSTQLPQTIALNWTQSKNEGGVTRFDLSWSDADSLAGTSRAHKYQIRRITRTSSISGQLPADTLTSLKKSFIDLSKEVRIMDVVSGNKFTYKDEKVTYHKVLYTHYIYMIVAFDSKGKAYKVSNVLDLERPALNPSTATSTAPAPVLGPTTSVIANGPQAISVAPIVKGEFSKSWLGERRVKMTWTDSIARNKYIIFRTITQNGNTVSLEMMKEITKNPQLVFTTLAGSTKEYVDKAITKGERYFYVIKAVNNDGTESEVSNLVIADVNK